MFQLRYNDKFNRLEEAIPYWKNSSDIPVNILDFIKEKSLSRMIYEAPTGLGYCPNCFNKINDDLFCSKCQIIYDDSYFMIVDDINKSSDTNTDYFYAFEVISKQVLLYQLALETYLYNENKFMPTLVSRVDIDKVFYVKENGLTCLTDGNFYEYSNMDKFKDDYGYLYYDNLEELKNTVYKYSCIWRSRQYFEKNWVSIDKLTIPLYNKSFEYLIKYSLYNLAFSGMEYKGNFIKTFGVGREYLDFMRDNDITNYELMVLEAIKIKDISLIDELEYYGAVISKIKHEFNIDILKLIEYFKKLKLDYNYFYEYYDYIKAAKEIGLNIKDKQVRYPSNFLEEHNKVCVKYEVLQDPDVDTKIKDMASKLVKNKYDDGKYVIYPADSLKSFYDEGSQQNNCVSTYYKDYIDGKKQVFFMREKANIDKSLVTIEVKDKRVVQARIKNNELPSSDLIKIIKHWENMI